MRPEEVKKERNLMRQTDHPRRHASWNFACDVLFWR